MQDKENIRLEKRRNYVKWKSAECNKHVICKWINRDCNQWRREGMKSTDINVIRQDVRKVDGDKNLGRQDVGNGVDRDRNPKADNVIAVGYKLERDINEINEKLTKTNRRDIQEKLITTYGETQLDNNEKNFLELGPYFAMYDDIDEDEVKGDFLTSLTKIRWDRMGKEPEEILRWRNEEDIKEEEEIDIIANSDRRIVDTNKRQINIGLKRCTEMKGNRRVIFPAGRPAKEETALDVRLRMWMETVRTYRTIETKEGKQKSNQLDNSQKQGFKSLEEKVKKGTIHIGSADTY